MSTHRPEYARIRMAFGASVYFRDLPPATLDALAAASTLQRCESGGLLHAAGTAADKLWLVIEGGLLASWVNAHGEAVPVAVIGPGSFYSAASLVEGGAINVEARAERDTVTAVMRATELHELAERDPALGALVPRLLLQRTQAVVALYADAVSAPLCERLARRLMAQVTSSPTQPAGEIEMRLSQTDLARMLGASRSKVNGELRRLEQERILRLGYRRVYLLDIEALGRIAGAGVPTM